MRTGLKAAAETRADQQVVGGAVGAKVARVAEETEGTTAGQAAEGIGENSAVKAVPGETGGSLAAVEGTAGKMERYWMAYQ